VKTFVPLKKVTINTVVIKTKVLRLVDKTHEKAGEATVFFSGIGDFFLFFGRTVRETFSRDFEFNEFLR
jgi:phospholipid/cholesterol/gamma-HCH transport system permease protein